MYAELKKDDTSLQKKSSDRHREGRSHVDRDSDLLSGETAEGFNSSPSHALPPPAQGQIAMQFKDLSENPEPTQKSGQLIQRRINNTGLPDNLKNGIENLSGYSMDDVKVHYNSSKPAQLQAHAYTQGTVIHVASGQEQHLPHEAWHVVQQKQGRVRPTRQFRGVEINDSDLLEREADTMGARTLSMAEPGPWHSDRHPRASSSPSGGVVQGKFGLEVELNVNMSKVQNPAADTEEITEPSCQNEPIIARGTHFNVHKDHSSFVAGRGKGLTVNKGERLPNYAIVELTTSPPYDEAESWDEVQNKLNPLLAAMTWFGTNLGTSRNIRTMPGFTSLETRDDQEVFVGGPIAEGEQNGRGHVHLTAGVALDNITRFMRVILDYHGKGFRERREPADHQMLSFAVRRGEAIAAGLTGNAEARKELAGLFALMIRYLKWSKVPATGELGKNAIGTLYYKSQLPQYRRHMTNSTARALLSTSGLVNHIAGQIIKAVWPRGGVADRQFALVDANVTNEAWVKAILSGTGPDYIIDEYNNEYSTSIDIERNDQDKPLFVMENRFPYKWSDGELEYGSAQEIKNLVRYYYEVLRIYNGHPFR